MIMTTLGIIWAVGFVISLFLLYGSIIRSYYYDSKDLFKDFVKLIASSVFWFAVVPYIMWALFRTK